jgi:Zn ribbon nucleic-acid-binding protein
MSNKTNLSYTGRIGEGFEIPACYKCGHHTKRVDKDSRVCVSCGHVSIMRITDRKWEVIG